MTEMLLPDGWPRPKGYANGVKAEGRIIAVAGQIGWDPHTERVVDGGFAAQVRQALLNVKAILTSGGAAPRHVVRLTWYVTSRQDYNASREATGEAYRDVFGTHYPAMTLVMVAGLLEPGALVEIEATAVIAD